MQPKTMRAKKYARCKKLRSMKNKSGKKMTYAAIGKRVGGISRQRVHQILTGYKSPSSK